MTRLQASLLYFCLVYLAGFVLGILREFFVTPSVGLTNALAIELPVMAMVIFFAARFVLDRTPEAREATDRLFVGCAAFVLLLIAEEAMTRILHGISVFTLWADFEPRAATVNIFGLLLFMLMPWAVARKPVWRKARR